MPFTTKQRRTYQNICHLTERGVLSFMKDLLKSRYETIYMTPAYLVAVGTIPVALVAHADTVFKSPPQIDNFFYDQEKDVIWNPDGAGADDRAGVYAITDIIRTTELRPHIIITTGEESGCIGSSKLLRHMPLFPGDLKFMIQLDRRGKEDSVYYDLDDLDFEEFINAFGFKTNYGSFTDISILAPGWHVAAVNFSIGYEDEHQCIERLHVDWMQSTIEKTKTLLAHVQEHNDEIPVWPYTEAVYSWRYGYGHHAWYDYDDDYPMTADEDHCFMCNAIEKKSDMMPIWYPHGIRPYSMCLDCYSDVVHQIVWCKKCNRGIFLSSDEAKKIPDKNNWICEDCANGIEKGTGTVQQGPIIQPNHTSRAPKHYTDIPSLESSEAAVSRQDEWDDLRAGYASDL